MTATQPTDLPPDDVSPMRMVHDRDAMYALAEELAGHASTLGLDDFGPRIVADTARRLAGDCLRVVVLGEIKHGKSSLVNALAGREVLPVGVTPTSGAVVTVRAGERDELVLVSDKGEATLDRERFTALARGRENGIDGHVEARVAGSALGPGIELIDTPGINDIDRFHASISRGELPRGDVLVVVLDATQLLNRTELAFVRDAIAAVGGLRGSGARLLVVINRVDLIAAGDHPALVRHVERHLGGLLGSETAAGELTLFLTDARAALRDPDNASEAVRAVARLREHLDKLAAERQSVLPARARAGLRRHATLLAHHAGVQVRALTLDADTIRLETEQVRQSLVDQRRDLDRLRELMRDGAERLAKDADVRARHFREQLEISALSHVHYASLKTLATNLPGSIHDAFVAYARDEAERLRGALEELTRKALHTQSEQARRRLAHATMRLGFRGPTVYVEPPSLALEASAVAVGLAGTAIMYFGNLIAGMTMTVAGPLATVIIREQSLRRARDRVRAALPDALDRGSEALVQTVRRAIAEHVAALDEHVVLADHALGDQLVAVLERARRTMMDDGGPELARKRVEGIERRLLQIAGMLS